MRRSVAGIDQVLALAQDALRSDGLSAEHHPMGFGNENWRLRDTDGSWYVLKIGDSGDAAKWSSSHVALELAQAAGLHVPRLVHLGELNGHLVRIFTWIDGETATGIQPGTDKSERLRRTTGAAVRALHTVARDSFSSRLDGSVPTFATCRHTSIFVSPRSDPAARRPEQSNLRCSIGPVVSLQIWQLMSTAAPKPSSSTEISTPTTSSWTPKVR